MDLLRGFVRSWIVFGDASSTEGIFRDLVFNYLVPKRYFTLEFLKYLREEVKFLVFKRNFLIHIVGKYFLDWYCIIYRIPKRCHKPLRPLMTSQEPF